MASILVFHNKKCRIFLYRVIIIRACLICVLLGAYIIFETLHTFSTCYQDVHVDLLIISPGEVLLLIVAMLLEALTVRYIWPDTVFFLLLALEDKVRHP